MNHKNGFCTMLGGVQVYLFHTVEFSVDELHRSGHQVPTMEWVIVSWAL